MRRAIWDESPVYFPKEILTGPKHINAFILECICLSLDPFIYLLSIHLTIHHPCVYSSNHLPLYPFFFFSPPPLPFHPSTQPVVHHPFIYPSTHLPIYPCIIYLSLIHPSVHTFVLPSIHQSIQPLSYLHIYPPLIPNQPTNYSTSHPFIFLPIYSFIDPPI